MCTIIEVRNSCRTILLKLYLVFINGVGVNGDQVFWYAFDLHGFVFQVFLNFVQLCIQVY